MLERELCSTIAKEVALKSVLFHHSWGDCLEERDFVQYLFYVFDLLSLFL